MVLVTLRRYSYCCYILAAIFVLIPFEYFFALNYHGPSTNYFNQVVVSAMQGDDKRSYIYVGDAFRVAAEVVRHRVNGSCHLSVWRVRQNIGGIFNGRISLIQHVDQAFIGDGEFRHTSWPIPPDKITVTEAWFDDPAADEQVIDVFVIARYYCNFLDDVFPRWLGNPELVRYDQRITPTRSLAPTLKIPYWNPKSHLESEHSEVVLKHSRNP